MRFTNFALLYLTLSFITGILLARSLELDIWAWVYISIPLITMLGLLVLIFKKKDKSTTSLYTGIAFLLFISIGALNFTLHIASKHHSHYSAKSNSGKSATPSR